MTRRLRTWLGRDWWAAVWFLAPALIILGLFVFYPLAQTIYYSFMRWDLVQAPRWVGLTNYEILLTDPRFWQSLKVTVIFTVGTVLPSMVLALAVAVLISRVTRYAKFYQAMFFLPVLTSLVIVATVWLYVVQPEFGPLNYMLSLVGIEGEAWLRRSAWALPTLMLMTVWRDLGYNMILFLAGLQNIPETYQEAASIDGANGWQQFWHITLPLLSPTTLFIMIVSVIRSFQVFTQIHVLTQGGPSDSTLALVYYIWQQGFRYYRAGYSSAIAVIFFLIILALSIAQMRIAERRVHYT